jgi:hypothetical protein
MCALCKSVLEPVAQPRHDAEHVLCKLLGTLRTIFIKLVRVFLNESTSLPLRRYLDITCSVKVVGTTNLQ